MSKVDRMLTANQRTILALSELKPSTTYNLEFRDSLVAQFNRRGDLTPKQWHSARQLVRDDG